MNAVARLFRTTLLNQCPNCSQAKLYSGLFHIRPKTYCNICNVRFEKDAGNWLMPTAVAYVLGAVFAAILGFILVRAYGFFAGLEWVLIAATLVFVSLIYKSIKSLWIWTLWMMGQVKVDGTFTSSLSGSVDAKRQNS